MDEQQRPPRPSSSFPTGATPPTIAGAERPTFTGDTAPIPVPDSGVRWPGRRTLDPGERVGVGAIAVFLAGFLALLVVTADWSGHPVLASLGLVAGVGAVVALVASAWAQRPDRPNLLGWTVRRLPRPTRRALLRRLRAGDPGPLELRSWAAYWTCLALQTPWSSASLLAVIAVNMLNTARPGPVELWRLLLLTAALLALGALVAINLFVHRPAAHRVADVLDRDTSPPPPSPGAA